MLANLCPSQPDPLWQQLARFEADLRPEKMDLIVGVYRDEQGQTPVMQVVQQAELALAQQAESKCYRSLSGNFAFTRQLAKFVLGAEADLTAVCSIQTVGGSGALRVIADFIARLAPGTRVWNSDPGYINHRPIMSEAGLEVLNYRWQSREGALDLAASLEDLAQASQGDVLLLHACCHNPTGIDPSLAQWQQLADFCQRQGVIPLIDIAYQGFADNPEQDAAGLRLMVEQLDTVLIATSCSKNMGLYCERTGAAMVVGSELAEQEKRQSVQLLLENITRANYSMPPEHGAAIANQLFASPQLWLQELEQYRDRVAHIRRCLGLELKQLAAPQSLCELAGQKGMFSLLPFTAEQMHRLRQEYAIYGADNGADKYCWAHLRASCRAWLKPCWR